MERHFLKVVVSAVRFEDVEVFIRNEREGEAILALAFLQSFLEAFDGFGADGDDGDAGFFVFGSDGREQIQLFDAMNAAGSEIKNDNECSRQNPLSRKIDCQL